jgi:hypothetical protein
VEDEEKISGLQEKRLSESDSGPRGKTRHRSWQAHCLTFRDRCHGHGALAAIVGQENVVSAVVPTPAAGTSQTTLALFTPPPVGETSPLIASRAVEPVAVIIPPLGH